MGELHAIAITDRYDLTITGDIKQLHPELGGLATTASGAKHGYGYQTIASGD